MTTKRRVLSTCTAEHKTTAAYANIQGSIIRTSKGKVSFAFGVNTKIEILCRWLNAIGSSLDAECVASNPQDGASEGNNEPAEPKPSSNGAS